MKTQGTRLKALEQKAPPTERQFIAWAHNPWTPAQMAKAMREEPERRIFWRSLIEDAGAPDRRTADNADDRR